MQGDLGEANEDVTQHVVVIGPGPPKWAWLLARLVGFTSEGSVLIFVTRKVSLTGAVTGRHSVSQTVTVIGSQAGGHMQTGRQAGGHSRSQPQ